METKELKVLLLEDNPGDAFLIKFYLGESASPLFHVTHAENLKAALEHMDSNKFDIIISDMNLPDSFGVDTIKGIMGKHPGNLVIVLTGLTDEEVGLETVRYGSQDFLVKGKFDGKVLVSSIMFAFERFKLNIQIANYSRKLDEENTRLEALQEMLNVGYFEVDPKAETIYRTDYCKNMIGENDGPSTFNYNQHSPILIPLDIFKNELNQIMQGNLSGTFETPADKNGNVFTAHYTFREGKLFGYLVKKQ